MPLLALTPTLYAEPTLQLGSCLRVLNASDTAAMQAATEIQQSAAQTSKTDEYKIIASQSARVFYADDSCDVVLNSVMYALKDVNLAGDLVVQGDIKIQGTVHFASDLTIDPNNNIHMSELGSIVLEHGDVIIDGVGLQEQVAFLYNYLFAKSYRTLCTYSTSGAVPASGNEAGREFDQDGDNLISPAPQYYNNVSGGHADLAENGTVVM